MSAARLRRRQRRAGELAGRALDALARAVARAVATAPALSWDDAPTAPAHVEPTFCSYLVDPIPGVTGLELEPCRGELLVVAGELGACHAHAPALLLDAVALELPVDTVTVTVHRPGAAPADERALVVVDYSAEELVIDRVSGVHAVDVRILTGELVACLLCGNRDVKRAGAIVGRVAAPAGELLACSSHSVTELLDDEVAPELTASS